MTAPVQLFPNAPYDPANYLLAGTRILLARQTPAALPGGAIVNATSGFRYIGNIISPDIGLTEDLYTHYSSAVGQDVQDFIAPIKSDGVVKFTTDEFSQRNMELFLQAASLNPQVANAANTAGPDIFIAGLTGEFHGLTEGGSTDAQLTSIKVYNATTAALLVLGTDYEFKRVLGRMFVHMLTDANNGNIIYVGEGSTASTPYHVASKAYNAINPLTINVQNVAAIVQIFPVAGQGFEWYINRATLTRGSKFNIDKKAASSMDFQLNVLDDIVNNPNARFGTWRAYGYNSDGTATV